MKYHKKKSMRKFNLLFLAVLGISAMACDDDEEYRGDWAKGVSYGGEPRTGAVSFVINDVAYVGLGYGASNAEFKNFYKFERGSWSYATVLPDKRTNGDTIQGRHGAVAFVIGNCAYVGTGFVAAYNNFSVGIKRDKEYLKDFYKYDATTGEWTQLPDFPGKGRRDAVAFSIGGYGYVGTGWGFGESNASEMTYKDFYCYDPNTNTWKEVPYDGASRYGATAFVIAGAAHVCLGTEDNTINATDHYKFIPEANGNGRWVKMQSLTDKPRNRQDAFYNRIPRSHAVSFIARNNEEEGEYAYVATGGSQYVWWYDHVRDLWHEVEELSPLAPKVRQSVAFSINGTGYFTTGGTAHDGTPTSQTWYFIPNVKENRGNDY
jgi:N-acetylneuraminic acid mutarotase